MMDAKRDDPETSLLYLSSADIRRLALDPAEVNGAVEAAFRSMMSGGGATTGLRADAGHDCAFVGKAGALADQPYVSLKWFAVQAKSAEVPNPQHMIMLSSAATGGPLALIEGSWITQARTAAISVAAAVHLASPKSASIGFLGAGAQSEGHLDAFRARFPIRGIKVYNRSMARAEAFCRKAVGLGLEAVPVATAREAIEHVDIVVTGIPMRAAGFEPLDARMLGPGAFVTMVDRGFAWNPETFSAFDMLVTDDRRLSGFGGPERLVVNEGFAGDIVDLITGRIAHAPSSGRTALIFSGAGFSDTAVALLAYRRARQRGIGTLLKR